MRPSMSMMNTYKEKDPNTSNKETDMIFVFDTETTGLCPRGIAPTMKNIYRWNGCRLVQIAWELYDTNGSSVPVASKEFLIRPDDFVIPETASRIHGITMEEAFKKGVPLNEVIYELQQIMPAVTTFVAHNIDFDMSVLTAELLRGNCEYLVKEMQNKQQICTMKRGTKKGQKWPKLVELYRELFNESPEEKYGALHRADVDVRCCADIYFHQERERIATESKK